MAFVLGSLFMVLLIIVYWDDIGGFNLYPLQEHKHESSDSASKPLTTTGPSTCSVRPSSSLSVTTTASSNTLVQEETGGTDEERAEVGEEEEERDTLEQRREETRGDAEKEERSETVADEEQEVRKTRIYDMCSGKDAVEFPGRTRAFEQIPNRELDHLIVDDTHQIIYCYVPKVLCFARIF